jgi:ankyrin repeat protein
MHHVSLCSTIDLHVPRFLLARLHTDSLLDKRTAKDVKLTLAKLSKGSAALNDAYGDALHRIKGQLDGDYILAKKVLSWITFAKRPLTTAEICCALAVEPKGTKIDPENVPDVEDLVSVCAGLVVVDNESAVIRLVHYTTQEYFEQVRDAWNLGGHLDIATTCLIYLSFSSFESGSCSTDKEFEERLQQNKFLDYAAKHWGEHARSVEAEMANLAHRFLLHGGLLSCATQALFVPDYKYEEYSQRYPTITALHCTARFGLCSITKEVLPLGEEDATNAIHAKDNSGRTPLAYAAEYGHREVAKLLLEKNADVNAQGGDYRDYRNALQAASLGGHEQVVRLLLEKNAEVNAPGGFYGNALQAASLEGHEQVVKLLLEKNADVNAQGRHYGNALQAASLEGHEQVVKLLLEKNADVNAQGGLYGNALQAASLGGHEQVVKLLISNGAVPVV